MATAFPIFDCEIGDEDAEVLVDARIRGHAALPHSDWRRAPHPVVDLRFDVQPSFYSPTRTFKVFRSADLEVLMKALPQASPQSWMEVRSFRGDVKRLEPGSAPTFGEVLSFLVD
ncbi:hypothetical protein [Streptomyces sp. NPDC086766]|uniref:hypothetical protein n=1 Tax=Streptomyces sp. NPDC086766 TaxID=3365754 RepID=UPI00382530F7